MALACLLPRPRSMLGRRGRVQHSSWRANTVRRPGAKLRSAACQRDFFRKWFREGDERCWFMRWGEEGEVEWTHPLYALTPEGRRNRHRLVNEIKRPEGERSEGFLEFMEEMHVGMPQHVRDIWAKVDLGVHDTQLQRTLESHDSLFVILNATAMVAPYATADIGSFGSGTKPDG